MITGCRTVLLEKKRALNAKNHENIQLASQITKLRDIMERIPTNNNKGILQIEYSNDNNALSSTKRHGGSNVLSTQSLDNEEATNLVNGEEKQQTGSGAGSYIENKGIEGAHSIYSEYLFLKRKTETQIRKNGGLKKSILVNISNFNESYELFLQAFHKYEDMLYKSQMVVHNQGLNGSLIFLLLNSKKKSLDNMNPVTIKDNRLFRKKAKYDQALPETTRWRSYRRHIFNI